MKTLTPALLPSLLVLALLGPRHVAGQDWAWVKAGEPGLGAPYSICVDAAGNTFLNAGSIDQYLAKFDPSGNLLWRRAGHGRGMAVDSAGNVQVVGSYYGQMVFGETNQSITLKNASTRDAMFLAKFDANGNVLWARQTEGWLARGIALAVDPSGNVYVTGELQQWAVFSSESADGTNASKSITLSDPALGASFLAKYSRSGDLLWAQTGGGSGVAIAANGDLVVAGSFSGARTFGQYRTLTSAGWSDFFVAQYTPDGNLVWVQQQNLAYSTTCSVVSVDTQGCIYLKAHGAPPQSAPRDHYLIKCAPDGQPRWTTLVSSRLDPYGFKFAPNSRGEVYTVGEFENSIRFEDTALNSHGPMSDFFLTKYDSDGRVVWARSNGGNNMERNVCVGVGPGDDVWVAGSFFKETTLGGSTFTATSWRPFLGRMNMALPRVVVQPANVRTNPGATVSFCAAVTNASKPTFQWMKDGATLVADARTLGVGTTCLIIQDVQQGDLGTYSLRIQDDNGTVTTEAANLWFGPLTQFISKTMLTNGIFQVDFVGEPGRFYNIEAATNANFLYPVYITNFFCGEGVIRVIDWDAASHPTRFYRAVSPP